MNPPEDRPRTRLLPPAPYAAALAGGWWLEREAWALPLDWGRASAGLGWLLVAAGLALLLWAARTLARHRTPVNPYRAAARLVTDGPYAYSRNPIYLGDWLLFAGVTPLLGTYWPLLFAPLVWAALRYGVIRHEEAHLEARFGDAYLAYRARVRRWI